MTTYLPRLALRLLVPALALGAIAALGEPLPAQAAQEPALIVLQEGEAELALSLEAEAAALRARADAAEKALHQSAAQMRWFVTLPVNSRRCISDSCSG
jgi:hypothetical protein